MEQRSSTGASEPKTSSVPCEAWRECLDHGTYVSAKHDTWLHEQVKGLEGRYLEALALLGEVDAHPATFAEAEGDIDRVHEFLLRNVPGYSE